MSDRRIQIERMLEGKAGGWYIGPDRMQTRAALSEVLADLPEAEFALLMDAKCHVQVTAPPCSALFHVAIHEVILTAATGEEVKVQTQLVYLSALLERLSVIETRSFVSRALTVALERLAGRSDLEALEIAGLTGTAGPAGGAPRPN